MPNSPYVRASLAQAALATAPPLIRQSLINDRAFRDEYGFRGDVVISLGDDGVSFQRSALFRAIRSILKRGTERKVRDTEGQEWRLTKKGERGELPQLALAAGRRRLTISDLAILSPRKTVRLRLFDRAADDAGVPQQDRRHWQLILADRAFDDDEVGHYHDDLRDTPTLVGRSVRAEIKQGETSVSSLVPSSKKYYERLVGAYDGSSSVREYAEGRARSLYAEWLKQSRGLLSCLLLSSHSALTAEIGLEEVSADEIIEAFEWLQRSDRLSQLGAIEVGLRLLPKVPALKPALVRLIETIRDDDVDSEESGFKLLSALFVLVDGELSRIRLFVKEPPFYRRLVSLAQASLIYRQIAKFRVNAESFNNWAWDQRGEQFYMQSLVDMRSEPRWQPDLATPFQLKADFLGRIMNAVRVHDQGIINDDLRALVIGETSTSLQSRAGFPYPYLPGPLEGGENVLNVLPPELSDAMESQLKAERPSFIVVINAAMIFRLAQDNAALAAKAIQLCQYRFPEVRDTPHLLSLLNGLATVAAVTRNRELAEQVRILIRRYQYDRGFAFQFVEAMRVCLVAAASCAELPEWRQFVGDWLTELAFRVLEPKDAQALHSHLLCLLRSAPELWVSCGKADAALRAICAR